jgi:hypothetical protein
VLQLLVSGALAVLLPVFLLCPSLRKRLTSSLPAQLNVAAHLIWSSSSSSSGALALQRGLAKKQPKVEHDWGAVTQQLEVSLQPLLGDAAAKQLLQDLAAALAQQDATNEPGPLTYTGGSRLVPVGLKVGAGKAHRQQLLLLCAHGAAMGIVDILMHGVTAVVLLQVDAPHTELQALGPPLLGHLSSTLTAGMDQGSTPTAMFTGAAAVFIGCIQLLANVLEILQPSAGTAGGEIDASEQPGPGCSAPEQAQQLSEGAVQVLQAAGSPGYTAAACVQGHVNAAQREGSSTHQAASSPVTLVCLDPPCAAEGAAGALDIHLHINSSSSSSTGRLVVYSAAGLHVDVPAVLLGDTIRWASMPGHNSYPWLSWLCHDVDDGNVHEGPQGSVEPSQQPAPGCACQPVCHWQPAACACMTDNQRCKNLLGLAAALPHVSGLRAAVLLAFLLSVLHRLDLPALPIGVYQLALLPTHPPGAPSADHLATACQPLFTHPLLVLPPAAAAELHQYWQAAISAGAMQGVAQAPGQQGALGAADVPCQRLAALQHAWASQLSSMICDIAAWMLSAAAARHTQQQQQQPDSMGVSLGSGTFQPAPFAYLLQRLLLHLCKQRLWELVALVTTPGHSATTGSRAGQCSSGSEAAGGSREAAGATSASLAAAGGGRDSSRGAGSSRGPAERRGGRVPAPQGSSSSSSSSRSGAAAATQLLGAAEELAACGTWAGRWRQLSAGFSSAALEARYLEYVYDTTLPADVANVPVFMIVVAGHGVFTDPYDTLTPQWQQVTARLLFAALFCVPSILVLAYRPRLRHGNR